MRKIKIHSEVVYLIALILISFAVCMTTAADFGVSMIVAPAYILSLKVSFLTFGQSEYLVQAIVFILFCILMKKVRLSYFGSFMTAIIYGGIIDFLRWAIPLFNPEITPPGSMDFHIRIILFISGMILTSFSVALFFHTYLCPQVYDYFVREIPGKYNLNRTKFKYGFDISFLLIALIMSLLFFHSIKGIGIGTAILTILNGFIIGFFDKFFSKHLEVKIFIPKLKEYFIK